MYNKLKEANLTIGEIGVCALDASLDRVIADLLDMGELENFNDDELEELKEQIYFQMLG